MFIHKYMQNKKDSVVTEGWGYLVSNMLWIGLITNPIISQMNIDKILNNPKIKKYVIAECEKLYKRAVRENPQHKVIIDVKKFKPDTFVYKNNTGEGFFDDMRRGFGAQVSNTFVGKFFVICSNDTNHVRAVQVGFGLQAKDPSKNKSQMVWYKVPAPTKQDLQDAGFRDTFS